MEGEVLAGCPVSLGSHWLDIHSSAPLSTYAVCTTPMFTFLRRSFTRKKFCCWPARLDHIRHTPCSVRLWFCACVQLCTCGKLGRCGWKKRVVCTHSLRFEHILQLTAQLAAMFSCCRVENSYYDGAWSIK